MSTIPSNAEDAREVIGSLKSSLGGLESRVDAFSTWLENVDSRVEELEEENDELREKLEALQNRLDVIEASSSSKEAKIRDIVEYAENKRSKDQNSVKVTPKEIKGAAGVSRRYAYDLIDDEIGLPAEHHWLISAEQAREQQYGNVEMDWDASTRGLVVDCEALHSDSEAVNKFTTRDSSEGGLE